MSAMSHLDLMRKMGEDYDQDGRDLDEIAAALGGEIDGKLIRCPSPGKPPDDRSCFVAISRSSRPFIYECEGSLRAAYAMLRERLGWVDAPRAPDRSAAVQRIWDETVPASGTLVEVYLRSRAINMPVPDALRFHPKLWHGGSRQTWPAMVAARTSVDGKLVAIHRTYLRHDGSGKAPVVPVRMDLGPTGGSAIRLSPVSDDLVIGEGIETTLSVMQACQRVGWAAGSAIALRLLKLPPEVRTATAIADGDDAGRAATQAAAARWRAEGRRIKVVTAPAGKDFNDLLIEEAKGVKQQ